MSRTPDHKAAQSFTSSFLAGLRKHRFGTIDSEDSDRVVNVMLCYEDATGQLASVREVLNEAIGEELNLANDDPDGPGFHAAAVQTLMWSRDAMKQQRDDARDELAKAKRDLNHEAVRSDKRAKERDRAERELGKARAKCITIENTVTVEVKAKEDARAELKQIRVLLQEAGQLHATGELGDEWDALRHAQHVRDKLIEIGSEIDALFPDEDPESISGCYEDGFTAISNVIAHLSQHAGPVKWGDESELNAVDARAKLAEAQMVLIEYGAGAQNAEDTVEEIARLLANKESEVTDG